MSESRDRQAKLLAETFHAEWADGAPAEFARNAAAQARRRVFARRAAFTAGGVAAVVAAVIALQHTTPSTDTGPGMAISAPAKPGYEIISDVELLHELNDRPLIVVQHENGAREFVLPSGE